MTKLTQLTQNKTYSWLIGLLTFNLTFVPLESAYSIGPWDAILPDNQTFLMLFLWFVGFFILGFFSYRVFLKNQVRQGIHPHIWSSTIIVFCAGAFLLVSFILLEQQIGLAYFAILGCIYLFVLLMLVFLGKALRPLLFVLVIIAVIVALRLAEI